MLSVSCYGPPAQPENTSPLPTSSRSRHAHHHRDEPPDPRRPPRASLAHPRRPGRGAAHGRPRRDDREHRPALGPGVARLLRRQPPVGHHGVCAGLRLAAAARRAPRRSPRPQADLHRRAARLRGRVGRRRRGAGRSACSSAPAPRRAPSGRCSRRPRSRCCPRPSPTRPSAARRSAIYGAIAGAGGAIGLLLGGVLTECRVLALVPVREPPLRRPRGARGDAPARHRALARARRASTSPGRSRPSVGSSPSSTASRTPRRRAGPTP